MNANQTEPLTIRDELCYLMIETREHMRNFRNIEPKTGEEYMACITALSALKGRLRCLREIGHMLQK